MSKSAQLAKDSGNKAFKKGNHALAIKHFSEAITIDPKDKSFYSNRSAAYAASAKHDNRLYENAIADALKVIELDADWGKGYARHANALFLKGDYSEAVKIYALGISKDPSNVSLTQGLQAAQKKIKKRKEKQLEDERKESDYAIGIDLGTTYSCVAVWKDDGVQIIQNGLGDRTTPSYVGWNKAGERFIGHPAKTMSSANSQNTIFDIKRVIGQRFGDSGVEQDIRSYPFTVEKGEGDRPVVVVDIAGKRTEFAPEEISAMVLGNMKETAETYLGVPVTKAVITVPAYFNDAQRNATKAAGKIAGLEVLRIINEPTAAALAYGLNNNMDAPSNVLVFDLGGGTFDVSLLHIVGGLFEVKATGGDTRLGGEDFDVAVVDFLLKEADKQGFSGIQEDGRASTRLRFAAEKAKRTLSNSQTVDVEVEALMGGKDFHYTLTRAKFESLNKAPFLRCMETVQRVLKDAKLKPTSVHEVVLVGGSTRIPKLQEMLKEFFGGKELCKTVNPDEAVAYGAAVQAGILSGKKSAATKDLLLMDITPLSLGIEVVGRVMSVIIPRNTHVPCVRKHTYTTESDYQTEVEICVYEGERMKTEYNNLLGKFMITGIERAKKGEPEVEVRFELDADGILKVTATDQNTGSTVNIVVENRQATTTDEVKRMIEEAELYKEKDREQVQKVEATEALQSTIFRVLEASKDSGVSAKLGQTLEIAANDMQDWLDDHADHASIDELRKQLRSIERRIQARNRD